MNQTLENANGSGLRISVSPHVRAPLTTAGAMFDVLLALLPATVAGVWFHGLSALWVILTSVLAAVGTEWLFCWVTGRPSSLRDGSAVVTGLLLALCLPPAVPLYIPCIGSMFAILVVKCLFGGLGKNFLNPALAGRCFLLISFGAAMTRYTVDGVTTATPLVDVAAGDLSGTLASFTGMSSGVIGNCVFALLLGGLFLWAVDGITLAIPLSVLGSFTLFMGLFGGHGFDPAFLMAHLSGGGIVMGALFMATDPVTSPATRRGHIAYGAMVGILSGLFRVAGNAADSVSYAIIFSNMLAPILDQFVVGKPYAYRGYKEPKAPKVKAEKAPKAEKVKGPGLKPAQLVVPALILCVITLLAGVALSGVYKVTKDPIEQQKMAANIASYQEVCPGATDFTHDDDVDAAISALNKEPYPATAGKNFIDEVVLGDDGSCVVKVTSGDAYDGTLTLAVGIQPDGTINGISFTDIHESAGMGMVCNEDKFKSQFAGVKVDSFVLLKSGGAAADNEIDSVSGASVSSGAVVNAVNAALDFWNANVKEGA